MSDQINRVGHEEGEALESGLLLSNEALEGRQPLSANAGKDADASDADASDADASDADSSDSDDAGAESGDLGDAGADAGDEGNRDALDIVGDNADGSDAGGAKDADGGDS